MRLALLSAISWLFKLTEPLFSLGSFSFSGRDLILITGGFFLVFKGTMEMHERADGQAHSMSGSRMCARFWVIVTPLVDLDALFSRYDVIHSIGLVAQAMAQPQDSMFTI